ncbi:MAG: two-component system nitrate/nitrite sensor histidine kinase NarX, partial [Gammaproteobacteria bacterium]
MPDTEKPSLPVGFLQAWFMQLDSNSRPTINSARRRMFLLFIGVLILAGVNLYLACVPSSSLALFFGEFDILFSLLMMLMILILFRMVWSQLLDPLVKLNNWADEMRAVNLDARVVFHPGSDFRELGNDINMLANMIEQLSSDTEAQLQKYTDHISRESKSLAILYDVASNINISRDLNELFDKSLQSICLNLNASAGIIRQFKAKGRQHVVASFGDLNHTFLASIDQFLPIEGGNLFGNESGIAQTDGLDRSTIFATKENDLQKSVITLSVMVKYREEALGAIHLFFNDSDEQNFLDFHELLLSIGQHLGTAVEKFRLLEDESQLLIMQERTRLSDELHDSLAQTIASLRIQLRVVGEMTRANDQDGSAHQLSRIEFTIDQANDQLRELIAHFRIPLNKQGF